MTTMEQNKDLALEKLFSTNSKNLYYVSSKAKDFLDMYWDQITYSELSGVEGFISNLIFEVWSDHMVDSLESRIDELYAQFPEEL